MTDDPLAALDALVETMRADARAESQDRGIGWVGAESAFRTCADALEAALVFVREQLEAQVAKP